MDTGQTDSINAALREISSRLGVLEERTTETLAEVRKTNGRVSALERFRWIVAGAGIVVAAVGTWAWDVWKTFNPKH
jgi:hypothetical protein